MKKLLFVLFTVFFTLGCSVDNDLPVQQIDRPNYRTFETKPLDYQIVFDPYWWTEIPFSHSDYNVFNTEVEYFNYIQSLSFLNTGSTSSLITLPIDFDRETAIVLYDFLRHTGPCGGGNTRFWIEEATEFRNLIEIKIGRDLSECGFFAIEKPILVIKIPKTYKPVNFIDL